MIIVLILLYISIRITKPHEIGIIQKIVKKSGAMLDNTKKLNRLLFPNQVKLGPKTSDIVFTCLKVFINTIWKISEPLPRPIFRFQCDLKRNDPRKKYHYGSFQYDSKYHFYVFFILECKIVLLISLDSQSLHMFNLTGASFLFVHRNILQYLTLLFT